MKWAYPDVIWQIPTEDKSVYLTFDDGPIPEVTPWVLSELEKFGAKATFFMIGNNVEKNLDVYQQVKDAGHAIGNHCYNHEKGWTTNNEEYFRSVDQTNYLLQTPLFRPPYGRIKKSQIAKLKAHYKIIMWDVLSHDYDQRLSPQECIKNVLENVKPGSIIVFHDSLKAWKNLKVALPEVLGKLAKEGYSFKTIR